MESLQKKLKKYKKVLSLMLTVVLVLTMAVPAFAVDATTSASEAWPATPAPTTPAPTTPAPTPAPVVTAPAPAPVVVAPVVAPKLYLGAGMVPNYRSTTRGDNLNLTTASVVFDENGKIVQLEWDVLEITKTMFNWIPAPADTDTAAKAAKAAKAEAIASILKWETKREEGYAYDMTHLISKGAADNLTKNEWFVQLDYFEEFFVGKTVTEVLIWFNKYTDADGRPYKMAYPAELEKLKDADKAKVAKFTDAEKEMLVDVTTTATMSLQDGHSYFMKALVKAYLNRELIKQ